MSGKIKHISKLNDEENNPCLKEQQMSYKCLNDNDYNYSNCSDYFDNFNNCKQFWRKVVMDRTLNFISPAMPALEDREKIKAEYKDKLRKKSN